MTLEQQILDSLRALPADKQQEVLNHVQHLRNEASQPRQPRKSGRGLWDELKIDVSAVDIDDARREMWKNFPRDDF